jgi:hypothetical protein
VGQFGTNLLLKYQLVTMPFSVLVPKVFHHIDLRNAGTD